MEAGIFLAIMSPLAIALPLWAKWYGKKVKELDRLRAVNGRNNSNKRWDSNE